ncbi:hypothetical protein SH449x_002941 [Pirellulaceae bacterium SH449]
MAFTKALRSYLVPSSSSLRSWSKLSSLTSPVCKSSIATLAATVAQAETLAMMGDRLSNIDREKLHARVMGFMTKTKAGPEPTPAEIEQAIGKR